MYVDIYIYIYVNDDIVNGNANMHVMGLGVHELVELLRFSGFRVDGFHCRDLNPTP